MDDDTQARLERLRQLDVHVDALLEAAVSLAETRRDVRVKATETPLPPGDPANLSRKIHVPDVAEEDVDPVALLETAVEMVRVDLRPALALEIAKWHRRGYEGPLGNVQRDPALLFAPEVARHVLSLISIARKPHAAIWLKGSGRLQPLFEHRFLPLATALKADADKYARDFLESFRDPLQVHDEILDARLSEIHAQAPPTCPDDVPIGQAIPPTEVEIAARLATWQVERTARQEEAYFVLRHAAQHAVEKLLKAAGQNPSDALHPFTLSLVEEALAALPKVRQEKLLAKVFSLSTKQIGRVRGHAQKFKVRARPFGHSTSAQCPQKQRKTPVRIQHAESATKRRTHDEDSRQNQTETPRRPARLPTRRRAARLRDQREPMAPHDRPRRGPSRPPREDGADPSG